MDKRDNTGISNFVKFNRVRLGLTQEQLAEKAGVGLRFIRDLEQGKTTLRMDKVNQVLSLFGHQLSPGSEKLMDPYEINRHFFNRKVKITLKDRTTLYGIIIDQIVQSGQVTGWMFVSNNDAIAYKKDNDSKWIKSIPHTEIDHIETQE